MWKINELIVFAEQLKPTLSVVAANAVQNAIDAYNADPSDNGVSLITLFINNFDVSFIKNYWQGTDAELAQTITDDGLSVPTVLSDQHIQIVGGDFFTKLTCPACNTVKEFVFTHPEYEKEIVCKCGILYKVNSKAKILTTINAVLGS